MENRKLKRVTLTITVLSDEKTNQGAIEEAWFRSWEDGGASNLPRRCEVKVEDVELTDEEWEQYCEGEALPSKGIPLDINNDPAKG